MEEIREGLKGFEVLPYSETYKILSENVNVKGQKGVLYVFAGPNGSGKSTLIASLYKQGKLKGFKYVGAEVFARMKFKEIKPREKRLDMSNEFIFELSNDIIKKHDSLVLETSLSKQNKLELIQTFKENGYKVIAFFLSPCYTDINIERVAQRVKEGGYNFSKDELINQFILSNQNRNSLIKLSDEYYEVDTSRKPKILENLYK